VHHSGFVMSVWFSILSPLKITEACTIRKVRLLSQMTLMAYAKLDPPPHRLKHIPFLIIAKGSTPLPTSKHTMHQYHSQYASPGLHFLTLPRRICLHQQSRCYPLLLMWHTSTDTWLLITPSHSHRCRTMPSELCSKKKVRGKMIGLGRSGYPTQCPVYTIIKHVKHLCSHSAYTTK
jgi:hypothetical protein